MGNSSSSLPANHSPHHSHSISKPARLGENHNAVRRRSSAAPSPRPKRTTSGRTISGSSTHDNGLLNTPPVPHRRTRSANASATDLNHSAPPPPYSEAVRTPSIPGPNREHASRPTANGSRHTGVFTVPATQSTSRTPRSRNSYLRAPIRQDTAENALETLRKFDTVIIVDDSGSMHGALWTEVGLCITWRLMGFVHTSCVGTRCLGFVGRNRCEI
jgi:hypothetical protein